MLDIFRDSIYALNRTLFNTASPLEPLNNRLRQASMLPPRNNGSTQRKWKGNLNGKFRVETSFFTVCGEVTILSTSAFGRAWLHPYLWHIQTLSQSIDVLHLLSWRLLMWTRLMFPCRWLACMQVLSTFWDTSLMRSPDLLFMTHSVCDIGKPYRHTTEACYLCFCLYISECIEWGSLIAWKIFLCIW